MTIYEANTLKLKDVVNMSTRISCCKMSSSELYFQVGAQNAKRLRQSDKTTDGRKSLWIIETASLLKNTILGQVQVNRRQKRHNIYY